MEFIDVLNELGADFTNRKTIDGVKVNGILDRVLYDVHYFNGMEFIQCYPAIIRVASLSTPVLQKYCAGEIVVGVNDWVANHMVGKPVQVSQSKTSPLKVRKAYGIEFGRRAGVHCCNMRPVNNEWTIVPSYVTGLDEKDLVRLGLKGVLEGGEVLWGNLRGISSVPVFYGYPVRSGGREINITETEVPARGSGNTWFSGQRGLGESQEAAQNAVQGAPVQSGGTPKNTSQNVPTLVHRLEIKPKHELLPAIEEEMVVNTLAMTALEADLIDWSRGEFGEPKWIDEINKNFDFVYLQNMGSRVQDDSTEEFFKKVWGIVREMMNLKGRIIGDKIEVESTQEALKLIKLTHDYWRDGLNPLGRSETIVALLDAVADTNVGIKVYSRDMYAIPDWGNVVNQLCNNPYRAGLLYGLNLKECDLWLIVSSSLGYGVLDDDVELHKYREIIRILEVFTENNEDVTILGKEEIRRTYAGSRRREGAKVWRGKKPEIRMRNLGVLHHYDAFRRLETGQLSKNTMDFCVDNGLISQIDDKYILTSQAEKEIYLYKKLWSLGSQMTGISDERIQRSVQEFEDSKGFTLEALQRDGIGLVKYKAGVLSGCAGSGKTTVSEGITKCLEDGFAELGREVDIYYAAPTGKAARRLAEVVGRPVKTLHSLLKIGVGGKAGYLSDEGVTVQSPFTLDGGKEVVFIFDEMAMTNINLLYDVVVRIPENANVYFLGDIKQLKPIGKGIPFKDILGYLPAVELGVSKRAAAGSGINYNCDLINNHSQRLGIHPIEERDDFQLIEATDAKIPEAIERLVKDLLLKHRESDIQIVTPYAGREGKNARRWAATPLNARLQPIFNHKEVILTVGYSAESGLSFRRDDRVIHVNNNKWNYKRYIRDREMFTEVETLGVANGEVGRITGYIHSKDVYIKELDRGADYKGVNPRSDVDAVDKNTWFVTVDFYDPDIEQDITVLYHVKEKKIGVTEARGKEFYTGDLENLELAYALTTHKMQGSQSPIVIIPLSSGDNTDFVNRNMVYTAISRAQKHVVLVGDVKGAYSTLERSRLTFSSEKDTLLKVLAGE